jgi:hypothetical protein
LPKLPLIKSISASTPLTPCALKMRATRAFAAIPLCRMICGSASASHSRPSGSKSFSDMPAQ